MQGEATRCNGTKKDGSPCGSAIVTADGYCYLHSPANRPRLRELHAAGGRGKATSARAAKLLPSTLRPVLATLLAALPKVESGDLDPRQASALAALAGAIVKVYASGELEERLQALEQAAQQEGKRA